MKKFLLLAAVIISTASYAQNVFTFGKNAVSKEEFLRAFNKNNNLSQDRDASLKEYLTLYTNFKLKVQAAKDLRLDTMVNQVADYRNFRRQIEENYMNDEVMLNNMVREAYSRSQKDIRLSHILIPLKKDEDTSIAFGVINEAYKALKSGKTFEEVALQYSKDESVKTNKGDLGYITLFSLPYEMETVAYNTPVGSYSAPFRTKGGYHIFKVTNERNAWGKIKVAQIFFIYPPAVKDAEKSKIAAKADSVYQLLKNGAKWEDMVTAYSQDRNTVYMGGALKEFGIGEYDPVFERAAFELEKPNDLSKPFGTDYGYHILKLIEKYPVETDWQKVSGSGVLKQQVNNDARANIARDKFNADVKGVVGVKRVAYDENSLWQFVDSFLVDSKFKPVGKINENTIIFSIGKTNVKASDFAMYVRSVKSAGLNSASKPYKDLMPDYELATTLEYYRNHLDDYNADFKYQLQEFKEGNLLFEIMEKKVWNKAVIDTVGQLSYYNAHRQNYKWQSSVGAVIITASDKTTAEAYRDYILKNGITDWRKKVEEYNGKLIADSGRFEKSQVPVVERTFFQKGIVTTPSVSEQDGSASFAYITEVYPDNEQRNFEDARGMVINDYQTLLEEKWLEELKKKYPVKLNDKVWQEILSAK